MPSRSRRDSTSLECVAVGPPRRNVVCHINKVTSRRSRRAEVTVRRCTVLVYNQPQRPTQPPTLSWMENETGQGTVQCPAVPCGWEGNRRLCVASAMRQTLLYIHLRAQWPNEGRWDAAIRNMEPITITAWVYRCAWHIGDGHGGSKQHDGGARWQLPPALHASRLLDVFRQLLVHLFSADVDRLSAVRRRRGQKQLYDAERHRQVPRVSQELRADVGREERRSDRRWTVHLRSAADPQRDGRTRSYRRRRRRP